MRILNALGIWVLFVAFIIGSCSSNKTKEEMSENVMKADQPEISAEEAHQITNLALKEFANIHLMVNSMSAMAIKKANSEEVQQFAKKMNRAHRGTREKLKVVLEAQKTNPAGRLSKHYE